MKLRKGYVSNSSTTSFCIFGARLPDDISSKYEVLEEEKTDLSIHYGEIGDVYVGESYENMDDSQTKKQFEEEILAKLKELFGDDYKNLFIGVWSEAFRDG